MSLRSNFFVGVTAALAASVIAPVVVPLMKRAGRPLAKSLVRGGLLLYEGGREAVARAGETMEDVIAEVRAEEMIGDFAMPGDPHDGSTPAEASHAAYGDDTDQGSGGKPGSEAFAPPVKEGRVA